MLSTSQLRNIVHRFSGVFFILLCTLFETNAQYTDLWRRIDERNYIGVLAEALPLYADNNRDAELNLIIGIAIYDTSNYKAAIPYLEQAISYAPKKYYKVKSYAQLYLGLCYFQDRRIADTKKCFEECARNNPSETLKSNLSLIKTYYGLDDYFKMFVVKETPHIMFHFHPAAIDSIGELSKYIQKQVTAYDSLQVYFGDKLPGKIDFYVWNDGETARHHLAKSNAFATPATRLIHTGFKDTSGHEIAHTIVFYAAEYKNKTRLINEGTAVYFDQTNRNRYKIAKRALNRVKIDSLSVRALWEDLGLQEEVLYPVGGAFVETLILQGGKEKYLQLLADQRYSNAQKIYGDQLDEIIAWFEKELNGPAKN